MSLGIDVVVVVTGGAGYVGKELRRRLLSEAESLGIKEVRALDVAFPSDFHDVAPQSNIRQTRRASFRHPEAKLVTVEGIFEEEFDYRNRKGSMLADNQVMLLGVIPREHH